MWDIEIETGVTAEHDKRCISQAMLAAVENVRDTEGSFDDFLDQARTDIFPIAVGYIADGLMSCNCEPKPEPTKEESK